MFYSINLFGELFSFFIKIRDDFIDSARSFLRKDEQKKKPALEYEK